MKFLIVEDEEFAASRLIQMIREIEPDAEIAGPIDSIATAVSHLNKFSDYDLIFLDIQLADGKSFSIFDQCRIVTPVIFTTAYDEFALQAFELNSIDYLLKPINREKLRLSLEKFGKLKAYYNNDDPNFALYELIRNLVPGKNGYKDRFLISKGDIMIPIKAAEIACFYANEKEVVMITNDNQHFFVPHSIEDLTSKLDPKMFFRVNRQYIIAADAIKKVHNYFNFKLKVELRSQPQLEIIISRARTAPFKAWLNGNL